MGLHRGPLAGAGGARAWPARGVRSTWVGRERPRQRRPWLSPRMLNGPPGSWSGQVLGQMWGSGWGRAGLLTSLSPCHDPPCLSVYPAASVSPPRRPVFCLFHWPPCPWLLWASPGPILPVCLSVRQSLFFHCSCRGAPASHGPFPAPWLCKSDFPGDCQELLEHEGRRGAAPRGSELTGSGALPSPPRAQDV